MTDQLTDLQPPLDIVKIRELLPHRYPFLLVDRIEEISETRIVGTKCVTMNEWFFQGHFPERPIMPGVLQIEAMAQTGAVLARLRTGGKGLALLAGVEEAKFRRIISPGDVLRIEVEELYRRRNFGRTSGKIFANGELASEAIISFVMSSAEDAK
jgi:3-hydroxyacyl-[acyl-carrier-protein] dehydratase